MKRAILSTLALLWALAVAHGQAFVNLDFEEATIQPLNEDEVFVFLGWDLAVPGWSHVSASDTGIVYYRSTHLGITPAYLLMDSQSPIWAPGALDGDYSLYFRSGFFTAEGGEWINAFIAQTGAIPADSRSVRFLATGVFGVFVNDVEIPVVNLGGDAYGSDITPFAGTVAELKILNKARPIAEEVSVPVLVDAITFSPVAIPEPSDLALFCASGFLLAGWGVVCRHRHCSKALGRNGMEDDC